MIEKCIRHPFCDPDDPRGWCGQRIKEGVDHFAGIDDAIRGSAEEPVPTHTCDGCALAISEFVLEDCVAV